MNPIPQRFPCVPWGLQSARAGAAGISRFGRDAERVTPLYGLAAGPAAGGRLASCPPFRSRRAWQELYRHSPLPGPILRGKAHILPTELRICSGHGDR